MLAFFPAIDIVVAMLKLKVKTDIVDATPFAVSMLRVVHFVLACHAAAIIGIAYFTQNEPAFTPELTFALAVGLPLLFGSIFCWFAAMTRSLFGTAIFFCVFLTLALAGLPMMMNVFFPMHLAIFSLAGVYGLSAIILMRYCFMQPMSRKK